MATNIVSIIMQYLTPDVIGRIADALGLDRGSAQTAVGTAVPALLAGLCNVAALPGGAQKLAESAKQQAGLLEGLSSSSGGTTTANLADSGSRMLSSLFGGTHNALAAPIAKAAGLSTGEGASLLGMLAPVVMGAIAKQQGGRSIDAGGIESLLAAQKDNIVAALPSGVLNQLGSSGLLAALGGVGGMAGAAAGQTERAAAQAAQGVADAGSRAARATSYAAQSVADSANRATRTAPTPSLNWMFWAVPLIAIAALLGYLMSRPAEQMAEQAATTGQSVTVRGVDLGKQVGDTFANLQTSLSDIKDRASAEANLPRLQQVSTQIDTVRGSVQQLTPEQRKVIAGIVNPKMSSVNRMFDQVLAIPGVEEVLKPTVDSLKTELAALNSAN